MKTKRIEFRMDDEAYQRVRKGAFDEGISIGEFVRKAEQVYQRVREEASRRGISVDEFLESAVNHVSKPKGK